MQDQPGLSEREGRSAGESGVAHLQRLKAHALGQAPGPAAADEIPKRLDRRRSPRFICSGSVEFQTKEKGVRLWGSLTDISLHGVYVEMASTFPVETVVTITVQSLDIRFSALAKVRASYPSLGMGVCFIGIKPDQQTQLELLLKALTGQKAASKGPPDASLPEVPFASIDARKLVDKVTEHFQACDTLLRDDFYKIAKRLRRS